MATTTVRRKLLTYRDFCYLVKDGQKGDLIEGVIYMSSPDNIDANRLFLWLGSLMFLFAEKRKLGRVYGSRVACRLDDFNAPEPDIFFVRLRRLHRLKRGGLKGAPDLALEIISPESVEKDFEKKWKQYESFEVPEYWIVDELEQKVVLLRLDSKGKYREVSSQRGILKSQVMTGFWLDPKWLWQDPLPDVVDTLQQILAKRS